MRVPIHFMNEDKCPGVKQSGGVISHLMTEVEVECLPKDLPEFIAVDLAAVTIGTTLHLSDLALPEGVQAAALAHGGDAAQAVVSVHMPRVAEGGEAAAGGEEKPS
jgi:large subunit ribosomal protein L25